MFLGTSLQDLIQHFQVRSLILHHQAPPHNPPTWHPKPRNPTFHFQNGREEMHKVWYCAVHMPGTWKIGLILSLNGIIEPENAMSVVSQVVCEDWEYFWWWVWEVMVDWYDLLVWISIGVLYEYLTCASSFLLLRTFTSLHFTVFTHSLTHTLTYAPNSLTHSYSRTVE